MERAKDIGDKINNGNLGENADLGVCADTTQQIPPDRQPPRYDKMPKAPKPDVPDTVVIEPQPDPETCQGVRTNTYAVEIANNPFYGIKFEYKSGTEIKDGDFDEFRFVVTSEQAAAMTSVQVEATAAGMVGLGIAALENCAFNEELPCGDPVRDEDGYFAFYFMGAVDNGDGTMTLVFHVQNMTRSCSRGRAAHGSRRGALQRGQPQPLAKPGGGPSFCPDWVRQGQSRGQAPDGLRGPVPLPRPQLRGDLIPGCGGKVEPDQGAAAGFDRGDDAGKRAFAVVQVQRHLLDARTGAA
jgi:hypothetical protein